MYIGQSLSNAELERDCMITSCAVRMMTNAEELNHPRKRTLLMAAKQVQPLLDQNHMNEATQFDGGEGLATQQVS